MATLISGDRFLAGPEFDERIARATAALAGLGLQAGDAIGLYLRNDFAFVEASIAAGRLGVYAVPINWHFGAEETAYILADSGAKAVLVHADLHPRIRDAIPQGVAVLIVETPPEIAAAYGVPDERPFMPTGALDWDDWVSCHEPWAGVPHEAPAALIYTSGTTGRPKGVRRFPPTPDLVKRQLEVRKFVFGFEPGMRTVMTGPMYHSAPNLYAMFTMRVGGLMVLQPRFEAEELLALIERYRITHLHIVPTMFVRLLRLPDAVKKRYDLSSLKRAIHGAAPCAPHVKRAMIDWWGPVIWEYYGGTESGALVACSSEEWLAHPGTVGKPIPGATVKAMDPEGREVPRGTVGELFLNLDSMADFTYQNLPEERARIDRGGLITQGDAGWIDGDGFIYLSDRIRDMVISGGVNIYPAEIEATLYRLEGVRDCAVFGVPDEEFGEAMVAVIDATPGAGLDEAEVKAHLKAHLASYKVPKTIVFQGDLPREDSGKIFKRRLRDAWLAQGNV
ncbi:acyl-CoA synthetase [Zavarzinia sp. CC-PAN008]|uniref:acyl-CoA synthetase n=1 Tax=Zavarzinia sp. CC-PAN008 TaxID=3243332 RepID=UPI003F7489EA